MIPLLLNTNAPDLPGNVPGSRVPCGVYDYMPSPRMVDFVAKRFPNTILSKNKVEHPFIQMIALIGSCGTIAYTKQSDFDFWICYHEGSYDREAIGQFKAKLRTIESWIFDKYNMEIHFYLNEISRVRNNIFADDDEQLSGSSIGVLLKEEFLRSSIVLNGKMPFWLVVPSNADDATYDRWHAAAQETALADRFIDLGNLVSIRQEDFLAAALFQILKSLGNPFKSIIKLGLLERYLNNYMDNPFICNIIKKNIHQGKMGYHEIDAYVIMFDYVYDYYSSIVGQGRPRPENPVYRKVEPMLASSFGEARGRVQLEKARIMLEYVKMELAGVENQGNGRFPQLTSNRSAGSSTTRRSSCYRNTGASWAISRRTRSSTSSPTRRSRRSAGRYIHTSWSRTPRLTTPWHSRTILRRSSSRSNTCATRKETRHGSCQNA